MHYTDKSVERRSSIVSRSFFVISYKNFVIIFCSTSKYIYTHTHANQLICPQYFASDIIDNTTAQLIPRIYVHGRFRVRVVFPCP